MLVKWSSMWLASAAWLLAGCGSTIEVTFYGDDDQNLDKDGQACTAHARVYFLKGRDAAAVFASTSPNSIWELGPSSGMRYEGPVQTAVIPPDAEIAASVELSSAPSDVTHVGILAFFRNCRPRYQRCLMTRTQAGDYALAVRVVNVPADAPTQNMLQRRRR